MKGKIFSAFFLFFILHSLAQETADKKIYLDSLLYESSEISHMYYRIIKNYYAEKKQNFYRVNDYYKSGKVAMTGTSKSNEYLLKEGQFVYYFENGNKKSSTYYKDGTEEGVHYEWYKNGNPKLEGEYVSTEKPRKTKLKIFEYWNPENIHLASAGNGDYEEITKDETNKGKIKDGFKDSIWTGSNKKIKYSYTESYTNAELVSGVSIDSNKVERTYKIVEIFPEPKGGIDGFYSYIGKNFKVPEVEKLRGKIVTKFEIDIDGNIRNPKVIRSIGYGTDAEALRVLHAYKEKWIPGEIRGITITSTYTFPISIQSAF
jgi:Gram-negative bacterial TonB protein C-terminal